MAARAAVDGRWEVVKKGRRPGAGGRGRGGGGDRRALGEANGVWKYDLTPPIQTTSTLYERGFERIMKQQNKEQVPPPAMEPKKPKNKKQTKKVVTLTNQNPKQGRFRSLEEALKALDVAALQKELDKSQSVFSGNPSVWLKDLASYLNYKLQAPLSEPTLSQHTHDYPYSVVSRELRGIIRGLLAKAAGSLELFFDHCLFTMLQELDKTPGESQHGYRICIQAILQDKPRIATMNLGKFLELLRSHQSRPAKCLTIMWAVGQAGFANLTEGLKVWLGIMLPVLGIKSLSPFAIAYLDRLLLMHPNLTKGFGTIGPKDFFPLLDFAYMPNNSLTPRSEILKLEVQGISEPPENTWTLDWCWGIFLGGGSMIFHRFSKESESLKRFRATIRPLVTNPLGQGGHRLRQGKGTHCTAPFRALLGSPPHPHPSLQEQLCQLYPRLKVLAFGAKPEATLHTYFPSFLSRATPSCPPEMKKELLSSLTECLTVDPLSASVWRQLYPKHLSQSSLLLEHLLRSWKQIPKKARKSLQETIQSFKLTNQELLRKCSWNNQDVVTCDVACKGLLQQAWGCRLPLTQLLLLVLVFAIGFLCHDLRSHSSFQASVSGQLLHSSGFLPAGQQACAKIYFYSLQGYSWLEETLPAWGSHLLTVVRPGLQLAWKHTSATVSFLSAHCASHLAWFGDSLTSLSQRIQLPDALTQLLHSLKELLLLLYQNVLVPLWHILLEALARAQEHCHKACRGEVTWDCVKTQLTEAARWTWLCLQDITVAFLDWALGMISQQ